MGSAVKSIRSGSRVPVGAKRTRKVRSPIDKAKAYEVVWPQVSVLFEATRRLDNASFVYVISEGDDGPIKIGVSKDPIARIRTMQTGNPRRLRIEYVLLGDMHIEKLLHEFWEPHGIFSSRNAGRLDAAPGTEWFKPEARDTLLPIIKTAVARQIQHLDGGAHTVTGEEMERIIRDARYEHGFEPHIREEVHLLAPGAGIIAVTRRSRI